MLNAKGRGKAEWELAHAALVALALERARLDYCRIIVGRGDGAGRRPRVGAVHGIGGGDLAQGLMELVARVVAVVAVAQLAGCDRNTGPGPEIHDTKYRAVDAAGRVLDAIEAPGECVYDSFTELTWEVKSATAGLRFASNTYSWYEPEEAHDAELDYRGLADGGECSGSACDTWSFVQAVNATGLCGYNDWRMPSRDELGSISDPRRMQAPPTINTRHFPDTQAGEYWSGNDYQFQHDAAWLWNFQLGQDRVEWKRTPRYLRLVRGTPVQVTRVKD